MTKARTLADFISDGSPLADGTISVSEVSGAAPLASPTFTGTVTATSVSLNALLPTNAFATLVLNNAVGIANDPVAIDTWLETTASDGYKYGDMDKNGSIGANDGLQIIQIAGGVASEAVTSRWYDIVVPSLVQQSWYADLVADGTLVGGGAFSGPLTGNVTGELDLSAIAETITDTAVDVFVYDTSKDSDGGAWRKRTQGTSWYNETLNTSTRGSRKEFPSVAVIVVENTNHTITIYDADDPNLPMWMVFTDFDYRPTVRMIGTGDNGTLTATVSMLNGRFAVGTQGAIGSSGSWDGLYSIDFISETALHYNVAATYGNYQGAIADRNSVGYGAVNSYDFGRIVNTQVNDVAMTVLPNAPIDAATGLPVPTIAVATAGGTSVIRDDGTVVDVMAGTNAYGVEFTKDHKLLHTANDANSTFSIHVRSIPSSDTTALASRRYNHDGGGGFTTPPISGISNESTSNKLAILPNHTIASATFGSSTTGGKPALNLLQEVASAPTKGMVAYTSSTYNTGWMNGDIKLATLSDTDDTDVTGSEFVSNGDFSSPGTTGWNASSNAVLTNTNNSLRVTNGGSANPAALYTVSGLTIGKQYTVTAELSGISNITGARVDLDHNNVDGNGNIVNTTVNVPTVGSHTFTAVTNTATIQCFSLGAGTNDYAEFDNVSVRLAEEDRSVNGNGLQVFGSITKNPVATGADLVAYSGFSGSNYLEQPYNSDLDFGTGDFCINFWINTTDTTGYPYLYTRSDGSTGFRSYIMPDGTCRFIVGNEYPTTLSSIATGVWTNICFVRSNGFGTIYRDGKEDASNEVSLTTTITEPLIIGNSFDYANPLSGSLALFRISATVPSPEQIAKIYEDEKVLFQENAQATLYGSSDAVTALAYDDSTELLHVGTSAGRSVFQGLRRVDNTTDAVGAAISASNGLVAED